MNRCTWAESELMHDYHDKEWGLPVHDDRLLFEMITLEGAQAGLTWATILKRRDTYKKAFHSFDVNKIAKYTDKDIERLMNDNGIIRNKLKIISTINNAKAFINIQKEFKSFDNYIWSFVNNKQINNKLKETDKLPASTELSERISKDLKQRGFNFVGATIIYAFMQAVGIVNDHTENCFRK